MKTFTHRRACLVQLGSLYGKSFGFTMLNPEMAYREIRKKFLIWMTCAIVLIAISSLIGFGVLQDVRISGPDPEVGCVYRFAIAEAALIMGVVMIMYNIYKRLKSPRGILENMTADWVEIRRAVIRVHRKRLKKLVIDKNNQLAETQKWVDWMADDLIERLFECDSDEYPDMSMEKREIIGLCSILKLQIPNFELLKDKKNRIRRSKGAVSDKTPA